NEGAQKVALARTVGTLSLSLRSAADASASKSGLTTISSFGGSAAASAEASAASLVNAVTKEPEGPKFKTVIVTRGDKVEEYKVPSPEPPQELQQ
ncbi:Flp pilus assembly protein CpaB, partial [Mesorhizobium sp. M1C.F.Ca.ET.210.01.1.1]